MARVTTVKAARKATTCGRCGTVILAGMSYRWAKPRVHRAASGMKLVRCMGSKCMFRPSDLTTSKMAGVYAAQESLADAMAGDFTPNDLLNSLQEAAETVRGVGEEHREGATAIEDGFGHETSQSGEMNEKADALDEYADALEGVSIDDADEYDDLETEAGETDEDEDEDRLEEIVARQREIRDDAEAQANDAIAELSI